MGEEEGEWRGEERVRPKKEPWGLKEMKRGEKSERGEQGESDSNKRRRGGAECRSPLPKTGINPIIALKNLMNISCHVCSSMPSAVCVCVCVCNPSRPRRHTDTAL